MFLLLFNHKLTKRPLTLHCFIKWHHSPPIPRVWSLIIGNTLLFRFYIHRVMYAMKDKAMYIKRNNEERLCNHCCSGRAISITYSECVFVALAIQHALGICHIVISSLPISIFPHYLIMAH